MAKQKVDSQKVVLNMEKELVKKLDNYAEKLHVNRTSAVSVILSMYLDGINSVSEMAKIMDELKAVQQKIIKVESPHLSDK